MHFPMLQLISTWNKKEDFNESSPIIIDVPFFCLWSMDFFFSPLLLYSFQQFIRIQCYSDLCEPGLVWILLSVESGEVHQSIRKGRFLLQGFSNRTWAWDSYLWITGLAWKEKVIIKECLQPLLGLLLSKWRLYWGQVSFTKWLA